jgi:hypothetical protein
MWVGQLAINNMKVGAADAAGGHLNPYLARPGLPISEIRPLESSPKLL